MTIVSKNFGFTGEVGVVPRRVQLVVTDNLSTITTAGYLKPEFLLPDVVYATDIFDCIYSYNATTKTGTYVELLPTITGGVITLNVAEGNVSLPTVANGIAVFSNTSGALTDNIAANNTVTTTDAAPGTIRAIKGAVSESNTTMTSGNLVGVRGEVDCVGASGGFLYGAQGKVIATGTLAGSSWSAGVFGQFDISAATLNAGQTACIWGDYGSTSGTITDGTGMRGIAMTNTTAAVLNAQDYRYGNASYLLELAGAGGTLDYYADAGTSAGSAGDAAHCAAQKVIKIEINGVAAYIPVFTQNT